MSERAQGRSSVLALTLVPLAAAALPVAVLVWDGGQVSPACDRSAELERNVAAYLGRDAFEANAPLIIRVGLRRSVAACVTTGACWLIGQGAVQSFGRWSEWHPFTAIPRLAELNVFGLFDFLTSNLLMPMSALLVSVFVGWRLNRLIPEAELSGLSATSRRLLLFALRYLCPIGIIIVVIVGFTE